MTRTAKSDRSVARLRIRPRGRHPWFYKKMVRRPDPPARPGDVVDVLGREGERLGSAFYNPNSEITLRMLSRTPVADPAELLLARLQSAVRHREEVLRLPEVTNGYRLAHAEADGLPGLVLDRFGDAVVAQVGSLGMYGFMEPLGQWLLQHRARTRLVLTVDPDIAKLEGISLPPPPLAKQVKVKEHGITYLVTPGVGHKTGFFADQREHRLRLRGLAQGRGVLDLCCHAGGFGLNAAKGGARKVVSWDLDEAMVAQVKANATANKLDLEARHGDAFDVLRDLPKKGLGGPDLIILDPPKWIDSPKGLEVGLPRYRDLNRLAMEALPDNGLLVTCSCSGPVSEDTFFSTLRAAAVQAGVDLSIVHVGGPGADHPWSVECPETRYLKVVMLRVRRDPKPSRGRFPGKAGGPHKGRGGKSR